MIPGERLPSINKRNAKVDSITLKTSAQLKNIEAGERAMHQDAQKRLKKLFQVAQSKEERNSIRLALENELITQHGLTPERAKEVLKKILGKFQP